MGAGAGSEGFAASFDCEINNEISLYPRRGAKMGSGAVRGAGAGAGVTTGSVAVSSRGGGGRVGFTTRATGDSSDNEFDGIGAVVVVCSAADAAAARGGSDGGGKTALLPLVRRPSGLGSAGGDDPAFF